MNEYSTFHNFGKLNIEIIRYEYNAQDYSCSSSGWTALIDDENRYFNSYGDPEKDGYLEENEFLNLVIECYLKDRDKKNKCTSWFIEKSSFASSIII